MAATKASILPVIISVLATVLSIAIGLSVFLKFEFASKQLSWVGWALTPVVTLFMLAWDFYLQRKGRAGSPNFIIRPAYTTVLTVLAYVSLVIAGFHIWVIAEMFSTS